MTRRTRLVSAAVLAGVILVAAAVWFRPARAEERTTRGPGSGGTLRVRVWEPGGVTPTVSVNVPVIVVSAAIKVASAAGLLDRRIAIACAGDEMTSRIVRLRGADIAALWRQISRNGPAQLVTVDDGAGSRVEIRID